MDKGEDVVDEEDVGDDAEDEGDDRFEPWDDDDAMVAACELRLR